MTKTTKKRHLYDQVFAGRLVRQLLIGSESWKEMRATLDQKISTLEPFTESIPSMYIALSVILYERFVKSKGDEANEKYRGSPGHVLYISAIVSSIFAANFGMIKFFKNGPTRFLPTVGPLDGLLTWKALLTFLSVLLLNIVKVAFLFFLVENRTMERWNYAVADGETCPQITWIYKEYSNQEDIYNITETYPSIDVFQKVLTEDVSHGLNEFLILNKSSTSWANSDQSCKDQTDFLRQKSLPTCFQILKPRNFPLCGIWYQRGSLASNFFLWSSLFVLPHLLLSTTILVWASRACTMKIDNSTFNVTLRCKVLFDLLLQYPQILITPIFSHFTFGPKKLSSRSSLAISAPLTWSNIFLFATSSTLTASIFLLNQIEELPGAHKDHKITAFCTILFALASILFVGVVLHLPALKTQVCRNSALDGAIVNLITIAGWYSGPRACILHQGQIC